MGEAIGKRFQEETRYDRHTSFGAFKPLRPPKPYKTYPDARRIQLPKPQGSIMPFTETVLKRRSVREYSQEPITPHDLGFLVWASTGLQRHEMGYAFRTAPSAGALYPIETYLVLNRVNDIEHGVYHYHVQDHCLEEIKTGDFGRNTSQAALGQQMCAEAAAALIWTAVFNRSRWKYQERAYRYIYIEAGHIAENLSLACVSLGLGSCHVAAFFDPELESIIGVDGKDEGVLYMTVTGYPR
jgi:SagB-type dehydrogenase family enzyme